MRIIVNASIITEGGALQHSANFIIRTTHDEKNQWFYIITEQVKEALESAGCILIPGKYLLLSSSPANLLKRSRIIRKINNTVLRFNPDLVYSIGAPSYIHFSVPEVQRLTNPWITHPNKFAFRTLSVSARISKIFKTSIQKFYLRKVRYFITQTQRSKSGIIRISNAAPDNIRIIANTLSPNFYLNPKLNTLPEDFTYFFSLAAAYPHKNLTLIPLVAARLKSIYNLKDFKFLITIPENHNIFRQITRLSRKLHTCDNILNLGSIHHSECIGYYRKSACVFLPTLLETSSATFFETMYCNIPLVTADTDIGRELCQDAAMYFTPFDSDGAAKAIHSVISNPELKKNLVTNGKRVFQAHSNFNNSYEETLDFFSEIVKKELIRFN